MTDQSAPVTPLYLCDIPVHTTDMFVYDGFIGKKYFVVKLLKSVTLWLFGVLFCPDRRWGWWQQIYKWLFLSAFIKLRKTTISFVMSVCMSVRPPAWIEQLGSQLNGFSWNLWFDNLFRKFEFHLHRTRITGALHEDIHTFMIAFRRIALKMRKIFQTEIWEKIKTHFMFNNFFPKIIPFTRLCGKIW